MVTKTLQKTNYLPLEKTKIMLHQLINFFKIDLSGKRVFGLDLLRCIAILLVLITHFFESIKPNNITALYYKYLYIDGVSLFFVLSGFLIGSILIKDFIKNGTSWHTLVNFWKRRWFRTLPNYYLVMLSVLTFNFFVLGVDITFGDLLRRLTFTQNFFSLDENYYKKFPESWSLAIEEWFYLITPFIIFLLTIYTRRLRASIYLSVCIILISISGLRFYIEFIQGNEIEHHLVIMRLDAILYGVLGASIAFFHQNFWKKVRYFSIPLAIIIFFVNKIYFSDVLSISLILDSLFVLLLLPFLSLYNIEKSNILTHTITWISLISYSIYLLNLFIIDHLVNPFTYIYSEKNSIKLFIFFGLTLFLSTLLYKYFEVPIMKWRDRITKKH